MLSLQVLEAAHHNVAGKTFNKSDQQHDEANKNVAECCALAVAGRWIESAKGGVASHPESVEADANEVDHL